MKDKIAKIAYNSNQWRKPSGVDRMPGDTKDFLSRYGFGHEEWLFRHEWQIDGWRYAFVQGVNKSRAKLLRDGQPFDVALFAVWPDKRHMLVGKIFDAEPLSDKQSKDALDVFIRAGWDDQMREEILEVKGDPAGLDDLGYSEVRFNMRFRTQDLESYAHDPFELTNPKMQSLKRFQLFNLKTGFLDDSEDQGLRRGAGGNRSASQPFSHPATAERIVTPEHRALQNALVEALRIEYPAANVMEDWHFVDVVVELDDRIIFYEVKTQLNATAVIREALGQILEYALHPRHNLDRPNQELVIVGRSKASEADLTYLDALRSRFSLPIDYREVRID